MPKIYAQKYLGYKRHATKAMIEVLFQNSERWDVPAQIIADNRDENYKSEKEDTIKFIRAGSLGSYDLIDWFSNNMNWSDVAEYAVKVETEPEAFDYEDDFCNCEKKIKGTI